MNTYTELDVASLYENRNYLETFISKANMKKIGSKIVLKMQQGVKGIMEVSILK